MHRIFISFIVLLGFTTHSLTAQETAYGFEVGLNFSRFLSDSELDMNGNELETFETVTGFHVGGGLVLKFTDNFGMKTHLLFSQMGGKNIYSGESVHIFRADDGTMIKAFGTREQVLNITNSYIDIPVMGYAKVGSKLEFSGGLNFSVLVGSIADGIFRFNGLTENSNQVDVSVNLDYNYGRDDSFSETDISNRMDNISLILDGRTVTLPATAPAYYLDYIERDGSYFNRLDIGLRGRVSFFLSQGLFLGLTANYGLLDTTNDDYNFSRTQFDGDNYSLRNDKDTNFSLQGSVGFSF